MAYPTGGAIHFHKKSRSVSPNLQKSRSVSQKEGLTVYDPTLDLIGGELVPLPVASTRTDCGSPGWYLAGRGWRSSMEPGRCGEFPVGSGGGASEIWFV